MALQILNTPRTTIRDTAQALTLLEKALARLVAHRYDAERHILDYGALPAANELKDLVAAADALPAIDPSAIPDIPTCTAFWLNTWNALLVHTLAHARPGESVRSVDGLFTTRAYQVGAYVFTLDDIEHGILRANARRGLAAGRLFARNDPRFELSLPSVDPLVHFGFYTACTSSPPLQAFAADNLADRLATGARITLDRSVQLSGSRLYVPRTFSWYQDDFGGRSDVIEFLLQHLPDDDRRAALQAGDRGVTLEYLEYDWTLNDSWRPLHAD